MNFRNIMSVAAYERKTLYRSWFFRIFSAIALFFLFGTNMGFFGFYGGVHWTPMSIPANIPYFNILFINVAQAIIAVFLASDFLRRDRTLDTTEVIYTRPVSNGEYVAGKSLGILVLFVGLVVAGLLMALIFNLIHKDVPVIWYTYFYYLLLITVPTLLFILGLSFLMMILIRNQAVTFVVLLGYIGLTLFYFKDKMHGVLDYMAFNLPMTYSDFIGFAEPRLIILHRLAYLLMGISFIFATIRFLHRLPQIGRWNSINTIGFIVFLAAGLYTAYLYYNAGEIKDLKREKSLALNNRYARAEVPDIISDKLDVRQTGRRLRITSELVFQNRNREPLDTLIFSLNPGFRIDSLVYRSGENIWRPAEDLSGTMGKSSGPETMVSGSAGANAGSCEAGYIREGQILKIIPEKELGFREIAGIRIRYSGVPDEEVAYLDISREKIMELKRIEVGAIDKKPGIFTAEYELLTPEIIWYPVAGVRFNNFTFLPGRLDFVSFSLNVKTNKGLTAVAPGATEVVDGEFRFRPEEDLNAFALAIGPFEKRTLVQDGVEYNLFLKPGHDFFSRHLEQITDTIPYLIKEEKDNYEVEDLDLYYQFKRINLVEVPVQFHAYERPQVQVSQYVQPEMILMPEKGAGLNSLDLARYKFFEQRNNRRQNETRTDKEIEVRIFKRFLSSTFFRHSAQTRPASGFGGGGGGENLISFDGVSYERNPYTAFPLYYSYMTGISSDRFPLFNSMMEIYLKEGFSSNMRQTFRGGMNDNEIANKALNENTIAEIFRDWDNTVTGSLISQMGSFVFLALQNRVGISEFDNFLYYYLEDHAFREIRFEQFSRDFRNKFGAEIEPYFETINTKGKTPTYIMSDVDFILTRDEIGEVYIVRFRIRNTGEAKGLVDVSFRVGGSFGPGGGVQPTEEKRLYELGPGLTKDIQVTLYEQPRMMTVNTLISGNVPSTFSKFLRGAREVKSMPVEEYDRVSDNELTMVQPGEITVDNEDPGFSLVGVDKSSKLKKFIESRKEKENEVFYESINPWWSPMTWTALAHTAFYGEAIRSAYVIRRGEGDNRATWETVLPAAGYYDVYVYIPRSAMLGGRGRRRGGGGSGGGQRGPGGGQGGGPPFADERAVYHYVISSNEGRDEIEFPLRNVEDGWNKVGAFHFPADTARIELSNDVSNGNRVIADAVKWVRR